MSSLPLSDTSGPRIWPAEFPPLSSPDIFASLDNREQEGFQDRVTSQGREECVGGQAELTGAFPNQGQMLKLLHLQRLAQGMGHWGGRGGTPGQVRGPLGRMSIPSTRVLTGGPGAGQVTPPAPSASPWLSRSPKPPPVSHRRGDARPSLPTGLAGLPCKGAMKPRPEVRRQDRTRPAKGTGGAGGLSEPQTPSLGPAPALGSAARAPSLTPLSIGPPVAPPRSRRAGFHRTKSVF